VSLHTISLMSSVAAKRAAIRAKKIDAVNQRRANVGQAPHGAAAKARAVVHPPHVPPPAVAAANLAAFNASAGPVTVAPAPEPAPAPAPVAALRDEIREKKIDAINQRRANFGQAPHGAAAQARAVAYPPYIPPFEDAAANLAAFNAEADAVAAKIAHEKDVWKKVNRFIFRPAKKTYRAVAKIVEPALVPLAVVAAVAVPVIAAASSVPAVAPVLAPIAAPAQKLAESAPIPSAPAKIIANVQKQLVDVVEKIPVPSKVAEAVGFDMESAYLDSGPLPGPSRWSRAGELLDALDDLPVEGHPPASLGKILDRIVKAEWNL
jgi:hypothetical protein